MNKLYFTQSFFYQMQSESAPGDIVTVENAYIVLKSGQQG